MVSPILQTVWVERQPSSEAEIYFCQYKHNRRSLVTFLALKTTRNRISHDLHGSGEKDLGFFLFFWFLVFDFSRQSFSV